jgi:hypothetical protein
LNFTINISGMYEEINNRFFKVTPVIIFFY